MNPSYRDGWTVSKTDYMIDAPKGDKEEEQE